MPSIETISREKMLEAALRMARRVIERLPADANRTNVLSAIDFALAQEQEVIVADGGTLR